MEVVSVSLMNNYGFKKVSRFKGIEITPPERKTRFSAGYDLASVENVVIPPYDLLRDSLRTRIFKEMDIHSNNSFSLEDLSKYTKETNFKPTLISTGYKCYLPDTHYLQISVRSSCPLKYWLILANGVGIIDSDYYNNPTNEGEIFIQLINLSPVCINIKKGDVVAQGVILPYEKFDSSTRNLRIGGLGSTDV